LRLGGRALEARATDFGHLGLFPEQLPNWRWIRERCEAGATRVLNLFAYTGAASLAAAEGGAEVCHVDASRGTVAWARENASLNGLDDAPFRWIVDEALKFARREARRGRRYEGIVLDPPSFGRGPKGEVFKIEEQLPPLLECCRSLLSDDARFVLLSSHSPGFSPRVLAHLLDASTEGLGGRVEAAEMLVSGSLGARDLPSGAHARWWRDP
jgi:23S rRNA (cytosine1962-C5)-methyltransferase